MNVGRTLLCVALMVYVRTAQAASTASVLEDSQWTPMDRAVKIWMSVMVTTVVNMAVRTWWEGTGVAVLRDTYNTINGTSVSMRTSARTLRSVGERRAITPWGASAASVPLGSTTETRGGVVTSTSAPPPLIHVTTAVPTQTEGISVAVHLDTTALDRGTVCQAWALVVV